MDRSIFDSFFYRLHNLQEPSNDEYMESSLSKSLRQSSDSQGAQSMNVSTNSVESAAPSSSNLTLIKVSWRKSEFLSYYIIFLQGGLSDLKKKNNHESKENSLLLDFRV